MSRKLELSNVQSAVFENFLEEEAQLKQRKEAYLKKSLETQFSEYTYEKVRRGNRDIIIITIIE